MNGEEHIQLNPAPEADSNNFQTNHHKPGGGAIELIHTGGHIDQVHDPDDDIEEHLGPEN